MQPRPYGSMRYLVIDSVCLMWLEARPRRPISRSAGLDAWLAPEQRRRILTPLNDTARAVRRHPS